MDRLTHNAPGFEYKVSWRQAEGSNQFWSHGTTKGPPFVVNGTGTYTPFEIKVQAVNSLGEGPAPVPEIGHSGEDSMSHISVFPLTLLAQSFIHSFKLY